jgi:hypothetical protein
MIGERRPVPEPSGPMVPNGPGLPAPAPASASAPWRDIRPELSAEPYVFAAGEPPPGVSPFTVSRASKLGPCSATCEPRAVQRYDPSARTLRVNTSCATPTGLATMSGVTAGPGGSRLAA